VTYRCRPHRVKFHADADAVSAALACIHCTEPSVAASLNVARKREWEHRLCAQRVGLVGNTVSEFGGRHRDFRRHSCTKAK